MQSALNSNEFAVRLYFANGKIQDSDKKYAQMQARLRQQHAVGSQNLKYANSAQNFHFSAF